MSFQGLAKPPVMYPAGLKPLKNAKTIVLLFQMDIVSSITFIL